MERVFWYINSPNFKIFVVKMSSIIFGKMLEMITVMIFTTH